MGIFVQDTFTGVAGALSSHAGEIGGWLVDDSGWPNNDPNGGRLNGSGALYASATASTPRQASVLSDVVAPALDMYAELHINVGAQSSSSTTSLKFYAHHQADLPSGTRYSDTSTVFFNTTGMTVYAPGGYGPPDPYQTDLPGVANNSDHVIRIEYRYGVPEIKFFFDGSLVVTWGPPMYGLPIVPGNFGIDIDSFNAPSGAGIVISSIELGTIAPPSAFWTDLTGSLAETIGA